MVALVIILLTVFCFLGWVASNVPTGPTDCNGIMGKIFGHNYEAACDTKESATKYPHSNVRGREKELETTLQKYRDVESTYIGHVCKRCGRKVLKSELWKEGSGKE